MMKQIKRWLAAAFLTICGLSMLTSCSDDEDEREASMPMGQWLYEGKGFLNDDYDAALFDVEDPVKGPAYLFGRKVSDGLWYEYLTTVYGPAALYSVEIHSSTSGTVTYNNGRKSFDYKVNGDNLVVTTAGKRFVFSRTSGMSVKNWIEN